MTGQAGEWAMDAWEQVFGPDPGLLRLRMAVRVVLSAAITLTVLLLLQHVVTVPNAAVALGLMVSIFGSMTLQDPTQAQQRVTLLLLPLPALVSSVVATLLSRWSWVPEVGFVLVVFGASLARLLGPRGMAFGMIGYIAYFLGIIMRPPLSQLPMEVAALCITVAAAYAVRFHLIKDRADASLRHLVRDARRHIAGLLGEVEAALEAGDWGGGRPHRLHRDMARLNDAMLIAEQQIESLGGEPTRPAVQESELGPLLFDLELAAERVVRAAITEKPAAGARHAARRRIALLRQSLLDGDAAAPPPGRSPEASGSGPLHQALDAMQAALAALPKAGGAAAAAQPRQDESRPREKPQGSGGQKEEEEEKGDTIWQDPTLRQAVQVAVSVSLAIALGGLISGQRWYWAALTAFITCIGVNSRGEAVTKGLQRIAGTIIGVAAGIFLAYAISGHTELALALILVCVFFAFYAFQAAHGVMVFWITIMLALLYGLLGGFKPELLWLRLEETAVGAAVGMLTATLLLPVRSQDVFRDAAQDFLKALGDAVGQAAGRLCDPAGKDQPLAAARELDRKAQALRRAIGPLKRGWIALIPARITQTLRIAMQGAYLARELAHAAEAQAGSAQGQRAGPVRNRADAVLREIKALREALEAGRGPKLRLWPALVKPSRAGRDAEAGWELAIGGSAVTLRDPLRLLDGLGEALRHLRRRLPKG